MNYVTRLHLLNFKKDEYFILEEINDYIDHINIGDKLTTKIEVRKQGEHTPVDYPIIDGRVDRITKCIEIGINTGKYQLVTAIGLHIDIETAQYLKTVINKLEGKDD